jgi:glutathione S-transferase
MAPQTPVQVFAFSGSPFAWRVLIVLEEKGLLYEVDWVPRASSRHRSPELLAMNPRGRLPIMRYGEVTLCESLAICHFLEASHPSPPLVPLDAQRRALALQRTYESEYLMYPFEEAITIELFTPPAERNPERMRVSRRGMHDELAFWEARFSSDDAYGRRAGPYLAGETFSLADVALYPLVAFGVRCKLRLDERYPRLGAWYAAITERPSVQKTWPPHWRGTEGADIGLNAVESA